MGSVLKLTAKCDFGWTFLDVKLRSASGQKYKKEQNFHFGRLYWWKTRISR